MDTNTDPRRRFAEAHPEMMLLVAGPVTPAGDGSYAYCTVLAERAGGARPAVDPWVVWSLVMPADRPAYCVWGGYHRTREQAERDYSQRVDDDRSEGAVERLS